MKFLITEHQFKSIIETLLKESVKPLWYKPNETADIDEAILVARMVINQDNGTYTKKLQNDSGYRSNWGDATSDKMEIIFDDKRRKPMPRDKDFVNGFKSYVKNLTADSRAFEILKELFNKGLYRYKNEIEHKDFGVLAWGVSMFMREGDSPQGEKQFLGTIGEKHHFPWLKIVDIKTGRSERGEWVLWLMKDKEGNDVGKFGTGGEINSSHKIEGDTSGEIKIGDIVSFDGIIKSHDNKFGKKQTMVGNLGDSEPSGEKRNITTIIIHISDEGALRIINTTPALRNLLTRDLEMGPNIMRVNNYVLSKIISIFPVIDGFEIELI